MKIAIIGASGFVGSGLLKEALDRGYQVTAIGTDQPVFDENKESRISVEDLAVAILDELENNQFIKRRFTVGY